MPNAAQVTCRTAEVTCRNAPIHNETHLLFTAVNNAGISCHLMSSNVMCSYPTPLLESHLSALAQHIYIYIYLYIYIYIYIYLAIESHGSE